MKKISVLLMSFIIAACVTAYNPNYWFNEVQVVNLSGSTITDVKVRVVGSTKSYSCEEVAQFALCQDYFGKRRYPQQGIELSWTHPDGSGKAETVGARIPAYFGTAFPLRIVMEIVEDGSVKTFYEQEEPDRGGSIMITE